MRSLALTSTNKQNTQLPVAGQAPSYQYGESSFKYEMTHTSALDLAKDGIYMNAVDTGWVTDEDSVELSEQKEKVQDFEPPLDIVDGAARVLDQYLMVLIRINMRSVKFQKITNQLIGNG